MRKTPSNSAALHKQDRFREQRVVEQAKLHALSELASYKTEELMDELGVVAKRSGRMLVGCCPVHGGDNPIAFNLYPDGHTMRGNWKCRSRGCEKVFQPTLLGLVRGVLSHTELGWDYHCGRERRQMDFMKSVNWLCKFVKQDWNKLKPNLVAAEKQRFLSQQAMLCRDLPETPENGWTREVVRARLNIPSPYYLGRGYDAQTLEYFDVGESKVTDPEHPMFQRVVVPVYDRNAARAIGVSGRSLHERCKGCERWHDPALSCPREHEKRYARYAKWRNSEGFLREHHLYGYWHAKDHIRKSGQVLLTEGPGEVWRAFEADCHVAVGLFGANLTDIQQVILEGSGAMEVVIATNNDSAGMIAAEEIAVQLRRAFRVRIVKIPKNDLGSMTVPEVSEWMDEKGIIRGKP